MSRVFVAQETALGRKVVIKVLPPELAAGLSVDRFHREIQLAASLQHPLIVPLLSAGQGTGTREAGAFLYYSMPLVEGESLRARLGREGELPVAEAIRILRDVADALSYAHRHGVIHRDIKPDNVLLSDQHALVTDFGVAKAVVESQPTLGLTETGLALGTPAYMAPEQAAGDPHTDHRADIYALGVLGYEILAGRPPFTGPSPQAVIAAQLTQAPAPLAESRASVPAALAAAIMRCLEKRPADRWQSAAEVLHVLDGLGTPSEVTVARRATSLPRKPLARIRTVAVLTLSAALIIAAAVGWFALQGSRGAMPLDPDLVAVAPFDVPDSKLALWREGLVDLLSRDLDGAGPLRSVPPTTVIRRWSGRADRPSASALGRRTGARLVVFGSLVGTGPDSARLTATALDVLEGSPVADIELRDAADRMDRLADSLTVRLLRELGRTRRIKVFRTTSVGSTSLPALKAFLQGEQWFRQAAWDSALASYERAIALDSKFPLAFRRASQVMGWQRSGTDSGYALALHAGALNHGLAPRDSLLLTTDSLFASVYSTVPRVDWSAIRRVHAIAQELTRRYPDDFESWYALGEARYHIGSPVRTTTRQALEAFDRAIESDSSFGPAYIHAVELAGRLDGPEAAGRHAKGYLRLRPTDASASGIGLADRIIEALRTRPAEIAGLLQDAAPSALDEAFPALRMVADSTEAAIAVSRALVAAPPGDEPWLTRADRERRLGTSLLYRGHLRDAVRILFQNQTTIPPILVEAALLSPVIPDSVARMFHGWLMSGRGLAPILLPWWTAQGDSTSLRELGRRSNSLAHSAKDEVDRNMATYVSQAVPAYLALVRRDTATAVRRLEALPDSLCAVCYFERLTLAQLLSARHEDAKAARLLDRQLVDFYAPSEILWTLERARVAERLGEREKASQDYQYVANVWRHADPELQPYVTEARAGLARVTAEPR